MKYPCLLGPEAPRSDALLASADRCSLTKQLSQDTLAYQSPSPVSSRAALWDKLFQMGSRVVLVLRHPLKFLRWSLLFSRCLVLALVDRLLFPFACRPISFYTEITRCYLGASLVCFLELIFSAPPGLDRRSFQSADLNEVPAIVVPPHTKLEVAFSTNDPRNVVLLYAHGGGYLFGEPLMYLDTYKRWVKKAEASGVHLTVVSVDYRTSHNTRPYGDTK